jgi:crotonobetainyl-CoA:carnitine CoA-transferase CaiB-like acyl-CoA transferase
VVTDALWEKFCALFGLDELWADVELRKNNDRVLARDRILPQIRELISGFTCAEVIAKLDGTGLPFAAIGRPENLFDDPHLAASQGLEEVRMEDGSTALLPTLPLMMGGQRPNAASQLPEPGADTRQILTELGLSEADIETVIGSGE